MPKCVVCGAEDHGPDFHGFPEDWSARDQAELSRQADLYVGLSDADRRFIVRQWEF